MLVLIDKCGCSGFKLIKGSTPFVLVGLLVFKDISEAEKVSKAILALKEKLNIHPQFEFRKTTKNIQEIFLNEICQYNFEVRFLMADKVGINDPAFKEDTTFFYHYLARTIIKNNDDVLTSASIKINKNIDRKFRSVLTEQLIQQEKQRLPAKFKFCDPKKDALIQLADMVIGTLSKYFTVESLFSEQLYNKLMSSNKIRSMWKLREASNTLH